MADTIGGERKGLTGFGTCEACFKIDFGYPARSASHHFVTTYAFRRLSPRNSQLQVRYAEKFAICLVTCAGKKYS
jgi:hypothetical protein